MGSDTTPLERIDKNFTFSWLPQTIFPLVGFEAMEKQKISLVWFRRDLRLDDHCALFHALSESPYPIVPLFIFDNDILDKLHDKDDARVTFIYDTLVQLNQTLANYGSGFRIEIGNPTSVFLKLINEFQIHAVYTNHDYEPYAIQRDAQIKKLLNENVIAFFTFKDQVVFEKEEVLTDAGKPYTVFTPYSRKWKALWQTSSIPSFDSTPYVERFAKFQFEFPSMETIGFQRSTIEIPSTSVNIDLLSNYKEKRDFPAIRGTSRLSVHLRFGTVSIRKLARLAAKHSETWLNELIWRDFYMMILFHFPHVEKQAFKKAYDLIEWRNNETEFERWCQGQTGYPLVDAGMRELNATGFMHNRVRMVVASFLTKHLLINWRWGERYFARKLLDFDLSANNGGWQWAAGSGCDAAPYFRVFNPTLQAEKFDPKSVYIRKWVPEFDTPKYVKPIVIHEMARKRCLDTYTAVLQGITSEITLKH